MRYFETRTAAAFKALTPTERACVVLSSIKRDEEVDELLHWTLPPEDAPRFLALVSLISGATAELGWFIRHQDALLGSVELLASFIHELEDAASVVAGASACLTMDIPEPISPVDAAARLNEAANERIKLSEATELAEELGATKNDATERLTPVAAGGTVSYAEVCSVAGFRPSAPPLWGAATLVLPDSDGIKSFRRGREELRDHLTILRRWTGSERVAALRRRAREALAARIGDHAVVLGAVRAISTFFEGEWPLYLEDEALLADIGERLSRLADVLGPVERTDEQEGSRRLVRALKMQAGLP